MRWRTLGVAIVAIVVMVAAAACGDDGGGPAVLGGAPAGDDVGPRIADVDPCSLLIDEEITAVVGRSLVGEVKDPNGGFISCSWNTGDVLVTIADSPTIVLAPGQDECPSPGIGETSVTCPGAVKFWVDGVHVSVTTISNVDTAQLEALARTIPSKLTG